MLLAPAALALLAGCAVPSGPAPQATSDGSADDAAGDFCSEFEANGGTGATIGPLQTWLAKEDLLPDVQSRVDAMGDISGPGEIASEWDTMRTYYTDLLAAVEELPAGGRLTDPSLVQAPDEYQAVTDYYFATC